MHITENRYGTVVVKTERTIQTDMEWDVFGFAVGVDVQCDVPVLTGTAKPTTTQYQKLNSAIHTGGGVWMYHIPGSTPEAPTVEWALPTIRSTSIRRTSWTWSISAVRT
jgi:predicted aconitase